MNLNHLQYFVTLAEVEHYTKAAKQLSITQPSLSHAVSMMEKELGVQLFEKRGRNVFLTSCGKEFLTYAKESLRVLEEGIGKIHKMSEGYTDTIEIAYIYTLGSRFIPELVRSFLNQGHPEDIQFHFTVGNTEDVLCGLREGRFDVGFCSRLDGQEDICFEPVTSEELVAVVPACHPLAGKGAVSLEETVPYPQVYFTESSGLRPVVSQMFKAIQKEPQIAYQIEEDTAMAGLVSGGFGIAVMPNIPLLMQLPVSVLKITEPVVERRIFLACRKDKEQSTAAGIFIRCCTKMQA